MPEKSACAAHFLCPVKELLHTEIHIIHVPVGDENISEFRFQHGITLRVEAAVTVALNRQHGNAEPRPYFLRVRIKIPAVDDHINGGFRCQLVIYINYALYFAVGVANNQNSHFTIPLFVV